MKKKFYSRTFCSHPAATPETIFFLVWPEIDVIPYADGGRDWVQVSSRGGLVFTSRVRRFMVEASRGESCTVMILMSYFRP